MDRPSPDETVNRAAAAKASTSSATGGNGPTVSSAGSHPDFPRLRLAHPEGGAVEVYLQGAHVASWRRPDGEEILFMSRQTRLERGVPIRGGIPLVFPQFSDRGDLPKHGFARTLPWEVVESGTAEGGAATVRLRLTDSRDTRALWPHSFRADLVVELDHTLTTTLTVANPGAEPLSFTSALHTYYLVGDVRTVSVHGLEGSRYLGVTPGDESVEMTGPLRIAAETDGVYARVADRLRIVDPSLDRTLRIETAGFRDAVVWNPWIGRARDIPDLGDDEYLTMLCVEPANIAVPTRLGAGEEWSGTQRIRVDRGA